MMDSGCSLGYYGGKPYPHNCKVCQREKRDNPESAAELFASREQTHPPTVRRISGCCDSALNSPDKSDF